MRLRVSALLICLVSAPLAAMASHLWREGPPAGTQRPSEQPESPSFVMDVTVPNKVADYLRDHPNPHIRIITRLGARYTAL